MRILAALDLLWSRGVSQVSPGTLGMVVRGKPFTDAEARHEISCLSVAVWRDGWIERIEQLPHNSAPG